LIIQIKVFIGVISLRPGKMVPMEKAKILKRNFL